MTIDVDIIRTIDGNALYGADLEIRFHINSKRLYGVHTRSSQLRRMHRMARSFTTRDRKCEMPHIVSRPLSRIMVTKTRIVPNILRAVSFLSGLANLTCSLALSSSVRLYPLFIHFDRKHSQLRRDARSIAWQTSNDHFVGADRSLSNVSRCLF